MFKWSLGIVFLFSAIVSTAAEEKVSLESVQQELSSRVIAEDLPQKEIEAYCYARVAPFVIPTDADAWRKEAEERRARVLREVVYRGEALAWRDAECKVEWLDEIPGGDGYKIKKLRYEILPGMWVPALLYEPTNLSGKVPVCMNVNGHDSVGKAAEYKQIRCINQAKRGMIVLNCEWLGMGQLTGENYLHYRMNQLDLCGSSGIAPFYLSMKRGLDILLNHPNADSERVAVSGLSGGGWQTIFISSLDTRVTLANPVAGYSSYRTRVENHSDLGDSEQTPTDLAYHADYEHLTAMLAPRAALLTYNAKDQCCFASGHALEPLLRVARPTYQLLNAAEKLDFHINEDPGTHNFEIDNRQALYRAMSRHFSRGEVYLEEEIECKAEVKTAKELEVPLPENNLNFNSLAQQCADQLKSLRRRRSQESMCKELSEVLRLDSVTISEAKVVSEKELVPGTIVRRIHLKFSNLTSVPATYFEVKGSEETVVVASDNGRSSEAEYVVAKLSEGKSVLAIDPFYIGENKLLSRDFLFAILVSSVGERPLGLQVDQMMAISTWLREKGCKRVILSGNGERTGLGVLAAAALGKNAAGEKRAEIGCEVRNGLTSLHQVIEKNYSVDKKPELFCFGLLSTVDIPELEGAAQN